MFKNLLAAAGIGGARVDTRLHQHQRYPGQLIEATILIQGGDAAQSIDGIDLALMTRARLANTSRMWRLQVSGEDGGLLMRSMWGVMGHAHIECVSGNIRSLR